MLYTFTNLSHVWINRKRVLKSPSALRMLLDTVLVELYEENLASHRNVVGKESILIDFQILWIFFFNTTKKMVCGSSLNVGCNVESESISMNFSYC